MKLVRSLFARRSSGPPTADATDAEIADIVERKTERLWGSGRVDDVVPGDVLLPTLLGIAAAAGEPLHVLDFGGAAGFHYLVAKQAFPDRAYRWAVVERPLLVDRARHRENDELRFFTAAGDAAAWLGRIDLLHSIAALPMTDRPEEMLAELLGLRPATVVWAKTPVADARSVRPYTVALSAHGPGPLVAPIADREVPHVYVHQHQSEFLRAHAGYRLVWRGTDAFLFVAPSSRLRSPILHRLASSV